MSNVSSILVNNGTSSHLGIGMIRILTMSTSRRKLGQISLEIKRETNLHDAFSSEEGSKSDERFRLFVNKYCSRHTPKNKKNKCITIEIHVSLKLA